MTKSIASGSRSVVLTSCLIAGKSGPMWQLPRMTNEASEWGLAGALRESRAADQKSLKVPPANGLFL